MRHVRHREHVRAADLSLGSDGRRHRRDPGLVGAATPRAGLTSVVFCYTIGKAQRLLAELARVTDTPVFVHGMMIPMIDAYRAAGVRDAADDAAGRQAARHVVRGRARAGAARRRAARRGCGGSATSRTHSTSGLMRVRGVRRQRAYDRGFVLSDHADWPALLADDHRNRREPGPRHARPSRAAGAVPARAGARERVMRTAWEDEARRRTTTNEALRVASSPPSIRPTRPTPRSRRWCAYFADGAARRRGLGGVLSHRPPAQAARRRHGRRPMGARRDRAQRVAARRVLCGRRRRRGDGGADPRSDCRRCRAKTSALADVDRRAHPAAAQRWSRTSSRRR